MTASSTTERAAAPKGVAHEYMAQPAGPPAAWQGP